MSDIRGEGWGSTHDWKADITDQFGGGMGTRYFCGACGSCFVHRYHQIPDIFAALENECVDQVCGAMSMTDALHYIQDNTTIFRWDWRAQPDIEGISLALRHSFNGTTCPTLVRGETAVETSTWPS